MKRQRLSEEIEPGADHASEDEVLKVPRRVNLSSESWLEIHSDAVKCSKTEFKTLWDCHPEESGKVVVYGKEHKVPRWMALYGSGTYTFSGQTMVPSPEIPDLVDKCFEFARRIYPLHSWNGALVNWYADGNHYIGKHSDDERDLVRGVPILSFSFGGERIFRITPRCKKLDPHILSHDFPTRHGSVIAMCGKMQSEFYHEITKTKKYVSKRINVTIRSFKQA